MRNKTQKRTRRLSYEILGLIAISALVAATLFLILTWTATAIAENYCFYHDVEMTEFDWMAVDRWIFSLGGIISAISFSLLFLALLGDRMAYIRTITHGIRDLQLGQANTPLPLEGNNELTLLADAINQMSAAQQLLREKEQALSREKEQFIRTLSHDIRTPLTSILAYSEYLTTQDSIPVGEQKQHLDMIRRKAGQIRDLTQLLLDADDQKNEYFADARLLMEQLAAEFEEALEDAFSVHTDLSGCSAFCGRLDVQQLRRIFDNLGSNVQKYADPGAGVELCIWVDPQGLHIRQSNRIAACPDKQDSYKLGLHSIRRIAQNYGGTVSTEQADDRFTIVILLANL